MNCTEEDESLLFYEAVSLHREAALLFWSITDTLLSYQFQCIRASYCLPFKFLPPPHRFLFPLV